MADDVRVRVRSVSRTVWQTKYEYGTLVEQYERGKPVPANLSTTNLILTEMGSNTGLCGVSWRLTKEKERKEARKQASQPASKKERKKKERKKERKKEKKKERNSDTTLITRKEQMIPF